MSNYSDFWLSPTLAASLHNRRKIRGEADPNYILAMLTIKRAISNFVRIITGENVKILFSSGKQSYATIKNNNEKVIVISSKLEANEVDVTVGLALHEAMHIKHSKFDSLSKLLDSVSIDEREWLRTTCNLIEDLRIDSIAYTYHVGYRGYYQKLYAYYLNRILFDNAKQSICNNVTVTAYISYLQLLLIDRNNIYPYDWLPEIRSLLNLIDITNIHLISSDEALLLSNRLYKEIKALVVKYGNTIEPEYEIPKYMHGEKDYSNVHNTPKEDEDSYRDDNYDTHITSNNGETVVKTSEQSDVTNESDDDEDNNLSDEDHSNANNSNVVIGQSSEDNSSDISDSIINGNELIKDYSKVESLFRDIQKIFDASLIEKKSGSKDVIQNLEILSMKKHIICNDKVNNIDYYSVLYEDVKIDDIDMSSSFKIHSPFSTIGFNSVTNKLDDAIINDAISSGISLAQKMQIRNEDRVTINARKQSGRIHNRSLYLLGTGCSDIFYTRETTSYNPTFIHITIDASGSMSGNRIKEAKRISIMIAKAASLLKDVHVSISFRHDFERVPLNSVIYNSKKNSLKHLIDTISLIQSRSSTPEALCFGSLSKYIQQESKGYDTYIINISDGEPIFSMKSIEYSGVLAAKHGRKAWENMLIDNNAIGLSYFVSDSLKERHVNMFKNIYTNSAKFVNTSSMINIINTINDMIMQNKSTYSH